MCIKVKCQVATHYIHMQPEKLTQPLILGMQIQPCLRLRTKVISYKTVRKGLVQSLTTAKQLQ